jgi:ubiquitin-like domain-containing CTD phosphatase 1
LARSIKCDSFSNPMLALKVLGTKREVIDCIEAESSSAASSGAIIDDLDIQEEEAELLALVDRPEVQEKLNRRVKSVNVKIMNPPREGKKLLVLDIDYTLFDLGGTAERPSDLARPFLHEFLSAAYEHWDIVIWSATSMKWVEVKMRELGVLSHPDYKVTFMLDFTAMITVTVHHTFDCKPLSFIWSKFPGYTKENTIMVDDLRQNFALNQKNGLKCRAYRKSHLREVVQGDKELKHIGIYLSLIRELDDLTALDHKQWEAYVKTEKYRREKGI